MGWCSGTQIFDAVLDAALPHITDKAARDRFVYKVAVELWDGDWDCEGESDYYGEFQHVLDGGENNGQEWTRDPDVIAKFPPVKHYRKTYVTPAIEWTGHNLDDLITFCEGDRTWGLATDKEVTGTAGQCPFVPALAAVYDYFHDVWIPFSVGDHIAEGPLGEHYPIEARALKATYVEVALT